MHLINTNYRYLASEIKKTNKKIIVYGAGMIGQIVVPYLVRQYRLFDALVCFVDMDCRKQGQKIIIDDRSYEITTPDKLKEIDDNFVILITNSKFLPILNFLDGISNLDTVDAYIVPVMQINQMEESESIVIEKRSEIQFIPKKIHFCWFGGKEKSNFLKECMNTWQNMCPDYEIIEWNEDNYDVDRHVYTREAYEKGNYGFVTDVARLDILYENGGIYLDTDVTLEKNLDMLLYQKGFIGTEKWGNLNSGGGCGFVAKHSMLKKMIEYREQFSFILNDGSLNLEACGLYETKPFVEYGFKPNNELQIINDVTIFPSYVNHPYDYMSCQTHKREATVSVHHFYGGWMAEEDKLNRTKTQEQYLTIRQRMVEE